MKLMIDLENVETWDTETVAHRIREEIEAEITRFIKLLVKDALREHESAMRALLKKTAQRDWKKVAAVLETLQAGG